MLTKIGPARSWFLSNWLHTHADVNSGASGQNVTDVSIYPCFAHSNSEGSGSSVQLHCSSESSLLADEISTTISSGDR